MPVPVVPVPPVPVGPGCAGAAGPGGCGAAREPALREPAPRRAQQPPDALDGPVPACPHADDVRGLVAPQLVVVDAARGVPGTRAFRRPLRHLVQVRREAPRRVRLEHVVVEHEVLRVRPVIRDLPRVVVPHHVGGRERAAHAGESAAAAAARGLGLADEPIHLAPVEVVVHRPLAMRAATIYQRRVVERAVARAGQRVGQAHGEVAIAGRDSIRARVRAEVRVERAVLLNDHHHVADLVDPHVRRAHRGKHGSRRLRGAGRVLTRFTGDPAAGERQRGGGQTAAPSPPSPIGLASIGHCGGLADAQAAI